MPLHQFISAGGNKEENIPDALKKSDTVITMLPSGKHVKSIYMGEDGIIKNANENLLLIDSSTIDVETSREVEKDANNNNLKMLEETGHTVGLDNVSLKIEEGETFVCMGLSGSGKSTLIRHLNRLIDPTDGEILIEGTNVMSLNTESLIDLEDIK